MLSVKAVALKLKVSEQYVRTLIRKEHLKALRVGNQWVVEEADLHRYIKTNQVIIEPDDHKRKGGDVPDIVALSFFTGAMGLDIGMEQAGISAVLACENDKACRMTIHKNRPKMALIGDITKYSSNTILSMAKIPEDRNVDIIFGGPPCQAFSTAGNRKGFDDQRGNVFLKYLSIIDEIRPTYVVIENVRGLLSAEFPYSDNLTTDECFDETLPTIKGGALLHILRGLRNSGYAVSFELYNAANFGAPQIRERVVMLAYRGAEKLPHLIPTNDSEGRYRLPKWRTLGDVLSGLKVSEHHYVPFPEKRLKYYRMLKAGQYWKDLPEDIQKVAMGNSYALSGGKTGFYRRLSYDKPSPTLVTHPAMPATDLAHPTEDRPLSVEEYSCIQEFPPDWVICGSLLERYKQIGNAVPIALGKAIGQTIINHMNGITPPTFDGFKYSRYQNTDETSWENSVRKSLKKYEVTVV
jgi:DNA-methyltransferase (dcm)